MKRALLIAGGTVGGLGAVLAITPPQITSQESGLSLGGEMATTANQATATSAATTQPSPAATKTAKSQGSSTSKNVNTTSTKTSTPAPTATATKTATPVASATPAATKSSTTKNVSGTFTGDPINIGYGIVQVQITVNNGKITDAQAVQTPSGRNDRWTQMAIPVMRQRTLTAQGSNITGVTGASYTSFGWYKSLVSALSKAGL